MRVVYSYEISEYTEKALSIIRSEGYSVPDTKREISDYWKSIHLFVLKHINTSSIKYNVDKEDLYQEAFLEFSTLLNKYKPAYKCPVIHTRDHCHSGCEFWKYCHEDTPEFGWDFYPLKSFLFSRLKLGIRNAAMVQVRYNNRFIDITSDDIDFDTAHGYHHQNQRVEEEIVSQERVDDSMMVEWSKNIFARNVVPNLKGVSRDIGELYFVARLSPEDIATQLEKKTSNIRSHLSRIIRNFSDFPKSI